MSTRLNLEAFIATDRLQSVIHNEKLSDTMVGALLFADISGYTGIVEEVERQLGAVRGADVMTTQINAIFDHLIHEIYRYGGVAVGFGGDAILAWFAGDDGLRALASALAMQQKVPSLQNILITPTLRISFALKVSIATGATQRFVAGDPKIQRFDLFTGEAMRTLAAVSQVTKRGQVVIDRASALRLDGALGIEQWLIDDHTDQRFAVVNQLLRSVPTVPLPIVQKQKMRRHLCQWMLRPVYESVLATKGRFTSAIRQVVALFFKFTMDKGGSSQAYIRNIDRYTRWVQQTLLAYNGYLIKLTFDDKGAYGLVTFGAPQDSEDAPMRAVAAAAALRTPPPSLSFVQTTQIGISQGRMLAGSFGNHLRAAYDLLGHDLTIANRLMMRAQPGQIIVTQQIAEAAVRNFCLQHLGAEHVKGAAQPIDLFAFVEPVSDVLLQISNTTVGRAVEIAQLRTICLSVAQGRSHVVRLLGPAGIGKTQLVGELSQQAHYWGLATLLADCESITQRVSYYPWRQLLQQLLQKRLATSAPPRSFADVSSQLNTLLTGRFDPTTVQNAINDLWGQAHEQELPSVPTTNQARQSALATIVATLLQEQMQVQPLMVVIEDVQWLDEASLQLLLSVQRALAEQPFVLLLTHRLASDTWGNNRVATELLTMTEATAIELKPFDLRATEALIEMNLGDGADALTSSLLYTQTQGNPLAVAEAVRIHKLSGRIYFDPEKRQWVLTPQTLQALRQAHCLQIDPSSGDWRLLPNAPLSQVGFGTPDRLQQMIFSRVDRLDSEHQFTLKVASVVGRLFDLELLQAVHPMQLRRSVLSKQLAQLQHLQFIAAEEEGTGVRYRFRHQLIQEGIYESMPLSQLSELHQAVGEVLAQRQEAAVEQIAYHYWRCRTACPEEALHYTKKAAQQAQAYANHTALDFYNQALQLNPQDATALKGKIEVLHVLGLYDEEKLVLEELTHLFGQNEGGLDKNVVSELNIRYLWGNYFVERENYQPASEAFEQVCLLAQQEGDELWLAQGLTKLGWVAGKRSLLREAEAFYEQAIAYSKAIDNASTTVAQAQADALNGLGTLFRQLRRYPQAESNYLQALKLSRQVQNQREEARTLNNLGLLALYQRQLKSAKAHFTQALHIRRAIGDRIGEGDCLANLTAICCDLGEYEEAIELSTRARRIHLALANSEGQITDAISLGIIYRELGLFDKAQTVLEEGLALAEKSGDIGGADYLRSNLGLVLRDRGEFEQARKCLETGLSSVESYNDTHQKAVFLSYLATVSLACQEYERAEAEVLEAIAMRTTSELLPLTADDRATLASIYKQTGRLSAALDESVLVCQQLSLDDQGTPDFPQRDWWIAYQVFDAAKEEEQAHFAAKQAYQIVMKRAQKLTDETLRTRYLSELPLHRLIWQVGEALGATC